jgi:hypothetical protein
MSMRRLSFAAALLAVVTACSPAATEPPPPDVYELFSIDGQRLPATRRNDGIRVLQEQLILNAHGVAMRNTTMPGTSTFIETASVSYAYTRAGNVITLGATLCPSGAACALHSAEEGTINGGLLTLMPVPSLSSVSGSVYVYELVGRID